MTMEEIISRYTGEYISFYVAVIIATWVAMAVSTLIDLWTGVDKARTLGEEIDSHGLRRTITKAGDYWRIQCFGLLIDTFGTLWFEIPYASIFITMCIVLIEAKSVVENLNAKKSHAAKVVDVIALIKSAVTDKDAEGVINYLKSHSKK